MLSSSTSVELEEKNKEQVENCASLCRYWFEPLLSRMYTLRHTYSSILSLMRRNMIVICVIFSTMWPTSSLNCSIDIGCPISVVRQVCSVSRCELTCARELR